MEGIKYGGKIGAGKVWIQLEKYHTGVIQTLTHWWYSNINIVVLAFWRKKQNLPILA